MEMCKKMYKEKSMKPFVRIEKANVPIYTPMQAENLISESPANFLHRYNNQSYYQVKDLPQFSDEVAPVHTCTRLPEQQWH